MAKPPVQQLEDLSPDLWITEYGLFHDLDNVVAEIRAERKVARDLIEQFPHMFLRIRLNGVSGAISRPAKQKEWENWLSVFSKLQPLDEWWDDELHRSLVNSFKVQVVLQPLYADPPDVQQFMARRKKHLPHRKDATPDEAALVEEMVEFARQIKAHSNQPNDLQRLVKRAAHKYPIDKFQTEILGFLTRLKQAAPLPFLYQVWGDIKAGYYKPRNPHPRYSEEELKQLYNNEQGWKAIVDQTDEDVQNYLAKRRQSVGASKTDTSLVKARQEREHEEEEEEEEEAEEEERLPKGKTQQKQKGKEKAETTSPVTPEPTKTHAAKYAGTPVSDLRAKAENLRAQAKKDDPLRALQARSAAAAHAERVAEEEEEEEQLVRKSARSKEAKEVTPDMNGTSSKAAESDRKPVRRFDERHSSATRLVWDSQEDAVSPIKTREQKQVIEYARAKARESGQRQRDEEEEEDVYKFRSPSDRPRMPGGRRKKRYWTEREIDYLLEGTRTFGLGNWAKILDHYPFESGRTSVDLKDKYRNILKLQAKDEHNFRKRLSPGEKKEQELERKRKRDEEGEEVSEVEEEHADKEEERSGAKGTLPDSEDEAGDDEVENGASKTKVSPKPATSTSAAAPRRIAKRRKAQSLAPAAQPSASNDSTTTDGAGESVEVEVPPLPTRRASMAASRRSELEYSD